MMRDRLSMLVVCGGPVDCELHKENVRGAVQFLHRELGITIDVYEGPRFYQELYSPWLGFEGISLLVQRAMWRFVISNNTHHDYDIINLAIPFRSKVPVLPWEAGIIGLADGICTIPDKRNSVIITKQIQEWPLDRMVIEHEIIHVLGGPHSQLGIMTPSASDPTQGEFVANDTRQFVRKCLSRPFRE